MLSEQPIELVFDHSVALADSPFQLLAVEDLDVTADVTNRSGILQATGSHGNLLNGRTVYELIRCNAWSKGGIHPGMSLHCFPGAHRVEAS